MFNEDSRSEIECYLWVHDKYHGIPSENVFHYKFLFHRILILEVQFNKLPVYICSIQETPVDTLSSTKKKVEENRLWLHDNNNITIIVTYIFKMLWCISCVHVLKEIYFKGGSMVESIIFRWCPSFFLLSNQDFIQSKNESTNLQSFIPKWFVNFWICDFSSVFNV